jgi:hypothetical protein
MDVAQVPGHLFNLSRRIHLVHSLQTGQQHVIIIVDGTAGLQYPLPAWHALGLFTFACTGEAAGPVRWMQCGTADVAQQMLQESWSAVS